MPGKYETCKKCNTTRNIAIAEFCIICMDKETKKKTIQRDNS